MNSIIRAFRSWFASGSSDVKQAAGTNSTASAPATNPVTAYAAKVEQEVLSLVSQGKPVQAHRVAQRARADAPGTPGLAYFHGLSLEHVGRHEEALEAYKAELVANPDHADARARCQQLEAAL